MFYPLILSILLLSSLASAQNIKLGLNWKPEPQFGGFYQAEVDGTYKNYGLQVQILPGGSGTPTVQMLAHQKIDFGIVSAEEIILSNQKNPKDQVVALFAVYQKNPQMIMVHKERGFKKLEDVFKGQGVLAIQSGLSYAQFLMKKFKPLSVKVVPYIGGITNFLNDKNYSQQGFATSEPLLAEASGVTPQVFLVADEGFNPYTTVVAVHSKTLKDRPEMVEKFYKAVAEGWAHYLKNPEAAHKLMNKLNPSMDLQTMKLSAEKQLPLIETTPLGDMTVERWATLESQLFDLGVIKSKTQNPGAYFFQFKGQKSK